MKHRHLHAVCVLLAALLSASAAGAADNWLDLAPAVRYMHRITDAPWSIHFLFIDVGDPSVKFRATASGERGQTTDRFGASVGALAAINGDFFAWDGYATSGLAVGNGGRWTDTWDGGSEGFFAFGNECNWALSVPSEVVEPPEPWMRELVSGRPLIVNAGVKVTPGEPSHMFYRNPRTAVGWDEDAGLLILMVVDGRRLPLSDGMTWEEEADEMMSVGAEYVLNLDGGGSSTMWISSMGIVNSPSDGGPRTVGNHLAVISDPCTPGDEEICDDGDNDCDCLADEDGICLVGWSIESPGSSDINGDELADLCARAPEGVVCHLSTGTAFGASVIGPAWSDVEGWDGIDHYATMRMGDINGDGRADICARGPAGMICHLSTGSGFSAEVSGPPFSDASGWNGVQYWSTIRMADVDGDGRADLCGRGPGGVRCYLSSGNDFSREIAGPPLSDADGWGDARYYATIKMADVNGDDMADICAREPAGYSCWLSSGEGFPTKVSGPAFSDASGFGDMKYWGTIRHGDVNGDGMSDVCARAAAGMSCYLSTGSGFGPAIVGPGWSDDGGWGAFDHYGTIKLADVNGDGLDDVCGRYAVGFQCFLSTGAGFGAVFAGPPLSDELGWGDIMYWSTLRLADISGDGMADLCARGVDGMLCYLSTGTAFGGAVTGPELSDALGWSSPSHYSTLHLMTHRCIPGEEVCDGVDNDCDGEIDEGCPPESEEAEISEQGEAADADASLPDALDEDIADTRVVEGACGCSVR